MPFTGHHLGAGLLVGYLLRRKVSWFTLLLTTSIVVDLEPMYVIVFNPPGYSVHGLLHTFLASVPVGAVVGALVYSVRGLVERNFGGLGLAEPGGRPTSYVIAGVVGWGLHVLMDSFLYHDIRPFAPEEHNPLYTPQSLPLLHYAYEVLFYVGSTVYLVYLIRYLAGRGLSRSKGLVVGMVAVGLGMLNLPVSPLSMALLAVGLLLTVRGLEAIVPSSRLRVRSAAASLGAAALLMYTTIPEELGGILSAYAARLLGHMYCYLFVAGYICLVLAVALVYPTASALARRSGDRALGIFVHTLLAGLLLTPLLLGLPLVALGYLGTVVRIAGNARIESS